MPKTFMGVDSTADIQTTAFSTPMNVLALMIPL